MARIIKGRQMTARYYKGREVLKEYKQGRLVYEKSTSIPDYLCFTALESGTFTLTIPAALSTNANSRLSYIEWSKDGRNWNRTENKNSTEITIPVDVVTGDNVYWRGSGTSMTSASVALTSDCRFTSTARFNASGHLLSLLKLDDYDATTGWASASFANLFYQATTLIDASGIILPALAAGNAYTFYGTFYECTNLVAAPDFNTSYTGNFMCFQMYRGCTSLTTMPKLPTTLSTSIFSGMFRGCTSLAITQPLNYSTLAENCFANMFYGCSSLAYVKCLATDISATGCLTNWLNGVSSTGTFIQAEGVTWPRGASGIPTGWLAYDEGGAIPNDYEQLDYAGNDSGRAWVNVGAVTHVLEAYQITFRTPVIGTQVICGYYGRDTEADPVQASQNYLYARESPDSFQHQHYRINGDSYSSQNGLLQNIRDTEWHTFKTWNDDGRRRMEFDGVDKGTSTQEYATKKENLDMYLFHYQGTNGYANVHISEFIRYEEDAETETMHLLPCKKKSDDVVGYWDTIGLQFLTSGNAHALIGGYLTNNENNE